MRIGAALLLVAILAACNRGNQNKDAVRQGLLDHLADRGLNLASMDINIAAVEFHRDTADATVSFTPKGAAPSQGMTLHYRMHQKGGRWEVVKTDDSGHGAVSSGAANPHEQPGSAAAANPQGAMPSPEDLPPVGKK